jgi:hypothetical protein
MYLAKAACHPLFFGFSFLDRQVGAVEGSAGVVRARLSVR